MANQQVLLTASNVGVLFAAASGVLAMTNTARNLVPWIPPKHFGFAAALVLASVNAALLHGWVNWVLMPVNASVLFCSAFGLNEWTSDSARRSRQRKGLAPMVQDTRPFFHSWIM
jgi:hypothetical protein